MFSPKSLKGEEIPIANTNAKSVRQDAIPAGEETCQALIGRLDRLRADIESESDSQARPAAGGLRNISRVLRGFLLTDSVALLLGFFIAQVVTIGVDIVLGRRVPRFMSPDQVSSLAIFVSTAVCVLIWFENKGHYRIRMPFWIEMQKVLATFGFAMALDGFLQFAIKQDISRLWLMSSWGFAAIAALGLRVALRARLRRSGQWQVRCLLIGDGRTADNMRAALASEPSLGYEIAAQIADIGKIPQDAEGAWSRLCQAHGADYVLIAVEGKDLALADSAIGHLIRASIPFSLSPPFKHLPVSSVISSHFFNHNVCVLTHDNRLAHPLPRFVKRAFDIAVAGTALLVISPIMLVLAALIMRDGGPAVFGHKRLGLDGKPFACLKFRSMCVNADKVLDQYLSKHPEARVEWDRDHKLRDDPRVTYIGRILRKTSLDELPQLINVVKGEMSLVGPRPIVMAEVEKYDNDIAHYYRVRPGITGVWQVSGRSDVSYRQRVQMDSWYVRNWSLWADVTILCKTIPALVNKTGAY